MGKDINTITISGHLGALPEVRITPNGNEIVNIRVACSGYKDETSWFDVSVYGKAAEFVKTYLEKGAFVIINGSMEQRSWENKETGKRQYAWQLNASDIVAPNMGNGGGAKKPEAAQAEDDLFSQRQAEGQSRVKQLLAKKAAAAPVSEDDLPY